MDDNKELLAHAPTKFRAYCTCCEDTKPASFRPCSEAGTGKPFEDLCCDECHFVIATLDGHPHNPAPGATPAPVSGGVEAALRLALDAMNYMGDILNNMDAVEQEDEAKTAPAFEAVRAALSAPAPKAAQDAVPLTDEQIDAATAEVLHVDYQDEPEGYDRAIARAIERAHGIGLVNQGKQQP